MLFSVILHNIFPNLNVHIETSTTNRAGVRDPHALSGHRLARTLLGTVIRLFIPASVHCRLVVHLTICCTVQLINNRFASVQVLLTILKTETTHTHRIQTDRIQTDRYTGVVIESVPD
jgi:hypothetical protein